jgi:hypothetical protein
MVRLLVRIGASISNEFQGSTVFAHLYSMALVNRHMSAEEMKMLETLLNLGSNTETKIVTTQAVESINRQGKPIWIQQSVWKTPLQIAVQKDDLETAQLLLRFNGNIKHCSPTTENFSERDICMAM